MTLQGVSNTFLRTQFAINNLAGIDNVMRYAVWCHLYNLEKCEKHRWRSDTFSKVAGQKPVALLKVTLLHGRFSRFLNCTNGSTKSHKTSYKKTSSKEEKIWCLWEYN